MKTVAKIFSAELEGIQAKLIEVEVDINVGLHSFNVVGLADKAVSEAKERINAALKNTGINPPTKENRRITINLAPADIKKTGSQFDLAMCLGYLIASGQIKPFPTEDKIFSGELSLDGSLRAINGALNIAQLAKQRGLKYLFLPRQNAAEAAIMKNIIIVPVNNLKELIDHLEERNLITPQTATEFKTAGIPAGQILLEDIKGQENAKRA
ncbi:MAG: magnesium chelatase domain-containing protein, partial [Patescibacteria group bacterium]